MESETRDRASEDDAAWNELARSAPRPAAGSGETSVPEVPPRSTSRTRPLGVASLAGTLTHDPEMRFVGDGKALVKVRLAMAERSRDAESGRWVDGKVEFIDVSVWGRQGEHVMECLRKGDRVVVNGMWNETTWTGKDEQEHTTRSVNARDIGPSLMFRQARVVRNKEGGDQ